MLLASPTTMQQLKRRPWCMGILYLTSEKLWKNYVIFRKLKIEETKDERSGKGLWHSAVVRALTSKNIFFLFFRLPCSFETI
jgi:cytochrome oxidase Cu insertion factor (SCO1/SenC/PrrC family)